MVAALWGMTGEEEECPLGIQGHPWVSTCLLAFAHPDLLPSGCQWAQGDHLEWETEDNVPQSLTARKVTISGRLNNGPQRHPHPKSWNLWV